MAGGLRHSFCARAAAILSVLLLLILLHASRLTGPTDSDTRLVSPNTRTGMVAAASIYLISTIHDCSHDSRSSSLRSPLHKCLLILLNRWAIRLTEKRQRWNCRQPNYLSEERHW